MLIFLTILEDGGTVRPPYNRNMYFYIVPIIKLLKMVTLWVAKLLLSILLIAFTSILERCLIPRCPK